MSQEVTNQVVLFIFCLFIAGIIIYRIRFYIRKRPHISGIIDYIKTAEQDRKTYNFYKSAMYKNTILSIALPLLSTAVYAVLLIPLTFIFHGFFGIFYFAYMGFGYYFIPRLIPLPVGYSHVSAIDRFEWRLVWSWTWPYWAWKARAR
jgi:hypothetical protein